MLYKRLVIAFFALVYLAFLAEAFGIVVGLCVSLLIASFFY